MLSMTIDNISSFMYSKLLVIILIGAGVYFTIRTSFPQVRLFHSACKAVMEKPDDEDAVSSFQALMVSTASRVGTGNIVGVSSTICIGGFGAGFRVVCALVVFVGAGMEMSMLWNISDMLMGVMAIINIPVILILSNTAMKALKDYERQLKMGMNPVFKSKDIGMKEKLDCWK